VKYHPKHVEQFTDLNKLFSVVSFWIIIAMLLDVFSITESTVSFVTPGCLSARMKQIGFHWTDFY